VITVLYLRLLYSIPRIAFRLITEIQVRQDWKDELNANWDSVATIVFQGESLPGKLPQAEAAFIRSRDGWHAQVRSGLATEAIVGLAGTKWKQGKFTEALSLVEKVLDALAQGQLEGVDEPIRIYLTCYHAGKLTDPAIRATFLERVPAHRELTRLWEARERCN